MQLVCQKDIWFVCDLVQCQVPNWGPLDNLSFIFTRQSWCWHYLLSWTKPHSENDVYTSFFLTI